MHDEVSVVDCDLVVERAEIETLAGLDFGGGLKVSHLAAAWRSTPIAFVGPSEGRFHES